MENKKIKRSPHETSTKLCKIMRMLLYMVRKSITKNKLTLDLNTLLKRGKTVISNMASTHHHHYSALTCRSEAGLSFVCPREYEFSCSNSPAVVDIFHSNKRKNHHNAHYSVYYNNPHVMHKVLLDMMSRYDAVEASPLPGFGCSPTNHGGVRQLRVTDSPFEAEDGRHGHQVDVDAEEFINKFYRDLKHQKKIATLEPPSPCHNMHLV